MGSARAGVAAAGYAGAKGIANIESSAGTLAGELAMTFEKMARVARHISFRESRGRWLATGDCELALEFSSPPDRFLTADLKRLGFVQHLDIMIYRPRMRRMRKKKWQTKRIG